MEDKSHILSLSQLMRNVAWATATSIINQRNTHHFALDKDAVGVIMMFDAYRGSSQTRSEKRATDNKKRNCFSTTSNFNFFSFGSGYSSFDASLHELLLLAFLHLSFKARPQLVSRAPVRCGETGKMRNVTPRRWPCIQKERQFQRRILVSKPLSCLSLTMSTNLRRRKNEPRNTSN